MRHTCNLKTLQVKQIIPPIQSVDCFFVSLLIPLYLCETLHNMINSAPKTWTLLTYLFVAITVYAQSPSAQIAARFKSFLAHENLKHGTAAIHVIDSKTGKTVYEHNSQLGLPTASTLKVITAITSLDLLGADYRFETQLGYSGGINDAGILHGDIIILGSGDPTLGSERYDDTKSDLLLSRWVQAIKSSGIKAVQGRIIADDRLYGGNTVPDGWPWMDIGNYYGAGVSALNWKENKAGIHFTPGNIGTKAIISNTTEDLSYLTLVNEVTTGNRGSGDGVYAYSAPYSNKIYLRGTYGQDLKKTIEISIPDPAYQLAYDVQLKLQQAGILVGGEITTGQMLTEQSQPVPSPVVTLHSHRSPPLTSIVHWFNQKSINLYGEALLQTIAKQSGKTTTADGASAVKKYWKDKLHLSEAELDIHDGSGLSPQNNVSPYAMNKIMQYAQSRPWHEAFKQSLPLINNMTMKSGTISGTLGYTGYHTASNGQSYCFAFLVYNYSGSASAMRRQMFTVLDSLR